MSEKQGMSHKDAEKEDNLRSMSNNIPPAPYPPMISARFPSAQLSSLRSSLSSTPHYTSPLNRGGGEAPVPATGPSSVVTSIESEAPRSEDATRRHVNRISAAQACRVQFCQRNLLACINNVEVKQPGSLYPMSLSYSSDDEGFASPSPSTDNRKLGPLFLELKRLTLCEPGNTSGQGGLFTTTTVCQSRGNPSFGTNVSSTCLQVAPTSALPSSSYDSFHVPPPCATGLTTGALCIHSFSSSSSEEGGVHPWTSAIEYFQTPRLHRPATAVTWRPTLRAQVAIGLATTSSSSMTTPSTHHHHNHHHHPASTPHARHRGSSVGGGGRAGNSASAAAAVVGSSVGRSATAAVGVGGGVAVGGGRAGTGDREYCCFVWDIGHQQPSSSSTTTTTSSRRAKHAPLFKLSHQIGVASLAWLLEGGQTLAVGGETRNLQLYDLRISGTSSTPPISVYAHNFGVHGIEVDPMRPVQFATFCRAANEPVKLWDARRMDSVLSEIKISGSSKSMTGTSAATFAAAAHGATVSSVKWSSVESGRLSVAIGENIEEYDTLTSVSRPIHVNTVFSKEPIVDFALYPYPLMELKANKKGSLDDKMVSELFPDRMITIDQEKTVNDTPRHTLSPLAISFRDGRLVHGLGRTLWIGSSAEGPAAMESLKISKDEDISATMMRRARCLHVAKYSMDAASNIKLLAEDGILAEETPREGYSPTRDALLHLWSWIERVEALFCSDSEDIWADGLNGPPSRGLIDAGAWRLLQIDDSAQKDVEDFSDALSCKIYDSPGRRAALTSCGWAGQFDLGNVLGECEDLGEYERSAALAVWHADIGAAVEALQRGAAFIRTQLVDQKQKNDARISTQYAETLELVALCVAGYRGGNVDSPAASVWRRACSSLMQQRPDLSGANRVTNRIAYIRSVLKFLMTLGSDDGHQEVLDDTALSLCDRVAFACRFLARDELNTFLRKCIVSCQNTGNVEGVTITGIEKNGVSILQSYVDRYADVQTAALVTSRVIFPKDWTVERTTSLEWLDSYRTLLNTWQMWQSRAMFDVDRAELLRKVKLRQVGGVALTDGGKTPAGSLPGRHLPPGRKPWGPRPDPDVQAAVPAQLDARCNYCSSPLGLKRQDTHNTSQWLSKMAPVLSCCPQCRKPLPRCAICMLSLGALNPYMELTKDRSRGSTAQLPDDLSSLASLPFAEWFTWCVRCKHGGHAHHLVGWFAKHESCPVSDCDCRCQFDGIKKINRPALSQRRIEKANETKSTTVKKVVKSQGPSVQGA